MRVALVVMPWWKVELMPLGVATLKSVLNAEGVEADCLYLNMKMAERIGPLADVLSDNSLFYEWFFAYHLFGPGGTGELTEDLADVLRFVRRPRPGQSSSDLQSAGGVPEKRLEKLLREDIPAFLDECLETIPWERYDLIGFSTTFCSFAASLKLARELKARYPGKPIAFGGANVEGDMGAAAIKGCVWIDYGVDGEGEEALLALVRALEKGKPCERIPGVSFRRGREVVIGDAAGKRFVDMTRLPLPDHGDFFKQFDETGRGRNQAIERPSVTFETSRGCWWGEKQHCTFCGLNGQGLAFRFKSADAVVETIVGLHRKHRARYLQATDNILALEHLTELLPKLAAVRRENGLDWIIFFDTKSNLTPRQMDALAAAGVTQLQLGIESLSTPVLKLMRKGVRAIQNVHALKMAQSRGIHVYWNFIFGFPGESAVDYEHMAAMVPALSHLQPPQDFGAIRIDRFSPYHFDWRKLGTGRPMPHEFYRFIFPAARFKLDQIAYVFEFQPAVRGRRRDGMEQALAYWQRIWPRNFLAYTRGMDFVEVHDSRPARLGGSPEYRSFVLESTSAFVFNFCEALRTFGQIAEACRLRDAACDETQVRAVLDVLVEKRWLLQEDNFFLNLAVPAASLPLPQKLVFAMMVEAARDLAKNRFSRERIPEPPKRAARKISSTPSRNR